MQTLDEARKKKQQDDERRRKQNITIAVIVGSIYIGWKLKSNQMAKSPDMWLRVTPAEARMMFETGKTITFETKAGWFALAMAGPNLKP